MIKTKTCLECGAEGIGEYAELCPMCGSELPEVVDADTAFFPNTHFPPRNESDHQRPESSANQFGA